MCSVVMKTYHGFNPHIECIAQNREGRRKCSCSFSQQDGEDREVAGRRHLIHSYMTSLKADRLCSNGYMYNRG